MCTISTVADMRGVKYLLNKVYYLILSEQWHLQQAYYSKNSLSLIRTLITGGCTPDLEQILAEGMTLESGDVTSETIINRERCKITQFQLSCEPFLAFVVSWLNLTDNDIDG